MLYQIQDGTVSVSGNLILNHIDFEIRGREKIAVVGENGAGKTTLLRVLSGELPLDRDDKRKGPGIARSRTLTIGLLEQIQKQEELACTVEELLLASCPAGDSYERERFAYETEYDRLFTGFGFEKKDKQKQLSQFSGGEQTKIAFIRLLLQKPDILLLDEPTNHLDISTMEWLEEYMREYEHAVVMVSHDRFFLDRTAEVIYELSRGHLERFPGDYSHYRSEKKKRIAIQAKAYERQQEEVKRLEDLIERFKHKPKKAAFARSRQKLLERMERVPEPERTQGIAALGEIVPLIPGSKLVLEAEHLKVGYPGQKELFELTFRMRKGQKMALMGANGVGKSTLLKTVTGQMEALKGKLRLGNNSTIGYFDQHTAELQSEKTVLQHFQELFPAMLEKEVRSVLAAYLFRGKDAAKQVKHLSGGERSRLALAELLQSRPNFLVLDEPTNHCDVRTKEVLEAAFQAYKGTILFVSHDRFFVKEIADSILMLEDHQVFYYPFGYAHYLERQEKQGKNPAARMSAEEQALIDGLHAVPKAERHRLKEFSTEEAYFDWRFEPVKNALAQAEKQVAQRTKEYEQARTSWQESEAFWLDENQGDMELPEKNRLEEAYAEWTRCCLDYWEIRMELEAE